MIRVGMGDDISVAQNKAAFWENYNEKLSYKRAVSVGAQLIGNEGFEPARIFVKGLGETAPIESNKTPDGRMKNRRAEILILLPQQEK